MGNYAGLVVRGRDGENERAGADVVIICEIYGDVIAVFALAAPVADVSYYAPYSEGQDTAFRAGSVYIVFGDDATETSPGLPISLNIDDLDGSNGFAITPDSDLFSPFQFEVPDFGNFANGIAALGDINGDGIDDFGITNEFTSNPYGYSGYSASPYEGEGVAYVILGGQTFDATQEVDDLAGYRIDVEGSELDVLETFDFDTVSVRVLVFETGMDVERDSTAQAYLFRKGFCHAFDVSTNQFWVKDPDFAKKACTNL